jgi:hypothetical protein
VAPPDIDTLELLREPVDATIRLPALIEVVPV